MDILDDMGVSKLSAKVKSNPDSSSVSPTIVFVNKKL